MRPSRPVIGTSEYKINHMCINCGVCKDECPIGAIIVDYDDNGWQISVEECKNCEGIYEVPNCLDACPVDAIVKFHEKDVA